MSVFASMVRGVVLTVAAVSGVMAGVAGEIAQRAAKAEQLLAADRPLEAYQELDGAMQRLWEKLPLTIARATFTKGAPQGFGIYDPREARFRRGEPLHVYVELVGFGHQQVAPGLYRIAIDGDVAIVNARKQVLAKMENFLQSRQLSRHRNREFFVHMKLELSGAPAGRYMLVSRLTDKATGQTATLTLPFEIGD